MGMKPTMIDQTATMIWEMISQQPNPAYHRQLVQPWDMEAVSYLLVKENWPKKL